MSAIIMKRVVMLLVFLSYASTMQIEIADDLVGQESNQFRSNFGGRIPSQDGGTYSSNNNGGNPSSNDNSFFISSRPNSITQNSAFGSTGGSSINSGGVGGSFSSNSVFGSNSGGGSGGFISNSIGNNNSGRGSGGYSNTNQGSNRGTTVGSSGGFGGGSGGFSSGSSGNNFGGGSTTGGGYGDGASDSVFVNNNNNNNNDDRSAIPGNPGVDYPVLSSVPITGFNCGQRGYYADTATEAACQVFHICQDGGRIDSFLCPIGTVFNQQYFVCDWWYNFDCSSAEQFYSLNENIGKVTNINFVSGNNIDGNNYGGSSSNTIQQSGFYQQPGK